VRANRRALRTIRDEPDLAIRYINALIPSLSEAETRRHYERYVAPYFTADGRHDPSVVAQAVPAVAEEMGVSTVPDAADIYRTEPAEAPDHRCSAHVRNWPDSAVTDTDRARKLSGDKLRSPPMEHHGRI
jgi:hypothetical protein